MRKVSRPATVPKLYIVSASCCKASSYNRIVRCPPAALLLAAVFLAACGNHIKTKEKVQEAIMNRLQTKSGLDLASLDVNTTSVTFDKDMAYATVSFHPKGDTSINSGMVMKYTLQAHNGKWTVVNVGDSQGHGLMGHPSTSGTPLPPGHPPVSGAMTPPQGSTQPQ